MTVSSFTVPAGASFFFFGSFVGFTVGAVLPLTGDQDLLLHLFTPTGPVVSRSLALAPRSTSSGSPSRSVRPGLPGPRLRHGCLLELSSDGV